MIVNPISAKTSAKAKIIVTAPTGSTVTCDGVVGTESSGSWEFSVNVGNHTIVGTLGAKTKSVDVLCDIAGEYQVEIDYKLWLYRDGDECEEVTGGWVANGLKNNTSDNSSKPTLTKKETSLRCVQAEVTSSGASKRGSLVLANNYIDLTPYNKICVNLIELSKEVVLYITNLNANGYGDTSHRLSYYAFTQGQTGVAELDVSNISGSHYLIFCLNAHYRDTGYGKTGLIEFNKVWLE